MFRNMADADSSFVFILLFSFLYADYPRFIRLYRHFPEFCELWNEIDPDFIQLGLKPE